jgi:hypothetical protein
MTTFFSDMRRRCFFWIFFFMLLPPCCSFWQLYPNWFNCSASLHIAQVQRSKLNQKWNSIKSSSCMGNKRRKLF